MRNQYLKKWKKTHRQRRKKREVVVTITPDEATMQKINEFCEQHHIKSKQKAIRKILRKAIEFYKNKESLEIDKGINCDKTEV